MWKPLAAWIGEKKLGLEIIGQHEQVFCLLVKVQARSLSGVGCPLRTTAGMFDKIAADTKFIRMSAPTNFPDVQYPKSGIELT